MKSEMADVHINNFEARYRLPPAAFSERHRLDQIRTRVLDRAFVRALAQAGICEDGELCIRNLTAAACLRLNRADESLTINWSEAIAAEIHRALSQGEGRNLVYYHSRRQALLDLSIGIASGDLRRVWVWQQLGLWRAGDAGNDGQAILEFVAALCAEATLLVPTLRALADGGWLSRIAGRLTEVQWKELAWASLREIGATHLLDQATDPPSPAALRNAMRVLKRSRLLGSISSPGSPAVSTAGGSRAVAVLAVLEAEPALLSASSASTMIGIIAGAIQSARTETQRDADERSAALEAKESAALEAKTESAARGAKTESAAPREETATAELQSANSNESASVDTAETESAGRAPRGDLIESAGESLANAKIESDDESESKPLDLRRRALTRFGGLLFLLGLVAELNLPEEILGHPALAARPFVWIIYQLGMALAPIAPDDPAALAFAGLPPHATPPAHDERPPSDTEAASLNDLAGRIVACLRVALAREDESDSTLLEFVCDRRAEVVADPGWIELRFSLDDVSTEIRRAGLDLDPGYVPWLGVVVKFVYE
jgi:hypothetical protein